MVIFPAQLANIFENFLFAKNCRYVHFCSNIKYTLLKKRCIPYYGGKKIGVKEIQSKLKKLWNRTLTHILIILIKVISGSKSPASLELTLSYKPCTLEFVLLPHILFRDVGPENI